MLINSEIIDKGIIKSVNEGIISLHNLCNIKKSLSIINEKSLEINSKNVITNVYWLWGRYADINLDCAKIIIEENFYKFPIFYKDKSLYWTLYNNEETVILDDLSTANNEFSICYLKDWIRLNPNYSRERDGSIVKFNFLNFFITSKFLPHEFSCNYNDYETLCELIKIHYCFQKNDEIKYFEIIYNPEDFKNYILLDREKFCSGYYNNHKYNSNLINNLNNLVMNNEIPQHTKLSLNVPYYDRINHIFTTK